MVDTAGYCFCSLSPITASSSFLAHTHTLFKVAPALFGNEILFVFIFARSSCCYHEVMAPGQGAFAHMLRCQDPFQFELIPGLVNMARRLAPCPKFVAWHSAGRQATFGVGYARHLRPLARFHSLQVIGAPAWCRIAAISAWARGAGISSRKATHGWRFHLWEVTGSYLGCGPGICLQVALMHAHRAIHCAEPCANKMCFLVIQTGHKSFSRA